MQIGYPAYAQKDEIERSRQEAKESAIASKDIRDIFDERKTVVRREFLRYRWKGDREDGLDGFEFEFKRTGVCLLNAVGLV